MVLWGAKHPAQAMSKKKWKMMKDDLEKEVRGLAQDIIQKNIGIGNKNIKIPPRFYMFHDSEKVFKTCDHGFNEYC